MGTVKPTYVKRISLELLEKHREKFKHDFDYNKKMVEELSDISSNQVNTKKLRNRVAGYITRKMRKPAP